MIRVCSFILFLFLVSCNSTSNTPRSTFLGDPDHGNYDRAAENRQKQAEVQKEIDRRNAAQFDEQTRRDLDQAIERNRVK